MSQTLSLQPGEYALFISPPVAGVDYTGTPMPTVSYQWRKNGTAIAGQTNATIGGVKIEQTGGTVDLVDGDVISIDIILTNPVSVATKTIAATIDSAIPAPVISPVSIRQLSNGVYQVVTSLANTDIGEQVIIASNTGGTVTTTPPVLTTYQWRRGFAPITGATSQTYTLQAADADSIIDCVVTATNSGGTTTATATVVVGTVADAGGWTALTPSADSRLIYVSNDGNDAAAATVNGRGYYLPSDAEIGPDPTNPVGPIVAYQTVATAKTKMRTNRDLRDYPNDPRYPDWLLFRRGDEFADVGVINGEVRYGGRSNSERRIFTAWGDVLQPRPRLLGASIWLWGKRGGSNATFASLDVVSAWPPLRQSFALQYGASNITIEDCRFGSSIGNLLQSEALDNVVIRRSVVSDSFLLTNHNQGLFVGGDITATIEECVFDRNGYKENPDDATTWTAGVRGIQFVGALPAGTGVQPTRTWFDRNMYLSSYDSMTLRGNIISRGGGGGSVQMREGGLAERNLFIWNQSALSATHPQCDPPRAKGSLIKDNVVLHDDHLLPDGGWGIGLTASGADDDVAVLDGNIVAHFHRGNNGEQSLGLYGIGYYNKDGVIRPASKLLHGIIKDNAIYREFGGVGIIVEGEDRLSANVEHPSGVLNASVLNNAVSCPAILSGQADTSKPSTFTYSGNKYHSTTGSGQFLWGWELNEGGPWGTGSVPGTNGTFSQWQAAGYDTDGTFTNDFASFKAAAGWTAPERDIVSYMQSVDPTYVVNEDVYVDEESSVKQSVRQKVWEVLVNWTAWPGAMTEAQAKLAARRYHAFITFIQRAKANRRGAWDTRWTAEAVNNYIRAGFGKAPINGAYDNRSLATRLAEYTS